MSNNQYIRNFSIIAHIDHGKSTLADRLLEFTGAVSPRYMREQFLDRMELERERGITIKGKCVRLNYKARDGGDYILNLIDTPGHVDFAYEVSRSLTACEGVLLVVDAVQGVEAQTLANAYMALANNLEIVPVINKIDLPNANSTKVKVEIEEIIGLDCGHAILASAKEGVGTEEILEAIVRKIPPPKGDVNAPLKALIFDSWFDSYQGVVVLVRVVEGEIRKGTKVLLMYSGKNFEVSRIGLFAPEMIDVERLSAGEVGYLMAGIKDLGDAKVGDTVTNAQTATTKALPGFKVIKPMVFCGLYPTDSNQYVPLKDALHKLQLNDPSFTFEPETSLAMGFGFRCSFLGMLHMEIVKERLEREYGLDLISTAPSVMYRVRTIKGEVMDVDNPVRLPPPQQIGAIEEPYIKADIHTPSEFLGGILEFCNNKRGIQRELRFASGGHVILTYELPFNEIILDFHDRLKSMSRGYASLDYEFLGFRPSHLVRLDILINEEPIDTFSTIVHKEKAYHKGREVVSRLKKVIPRQLFEVIIQAAIGSRVIARERIAPLRKKVTAKCYGGDITRKRKLLEKQKGGKKRMKQVGKVSIPQEAFLAVFGVRS